ncbi:MAG: hypothetical protein M0Z66_16025 [Thermaerobacter sp.]|nr:hypothetical protein [Thermaerobacter sp.]
MIDGRCPICDARPLQCYHSWEEMRAEYRRRQERAHAQRKSQALVLNEVLDAARECRAVMSAEARDMLYQMANEWSGADFAPSRAALTECISHGWIEFAANKAGGRWRAVRITELGRAALGARKEGGGDD